MPVLLDRTALAAAAFACPEGRASKRKHKITCRQQGRTRPIFDLYVLMHYPLVASSTSLQLRFSPTRGLDSEQHECREAEECGEADDVRTGGE